MTVTSRDSLLSTADSSKLSAHRARPLRILFLHHSTGRYVWNGGKGSFIFRVRKKLFSVLGCKFTGITFAESLFVKHNRKFGTNYTVEARTFPQKTPYGWHNYPFDYYNIWVKNCGFHPFLQEPTLELLTQQYQVIMFKHCFPVSNIQSDQTKTDINSDYKSLANYHLQYLALRKKLNEFGNTKFIVWTGAARVKSQIKESEAQRAKEFFNWVVNDWALPSRNIFVWDFYELQTEGQLYFQENFSQSQNDSHPNATFSKSAAKLLFRRTVDVIESEGARTSPTGASKIRPEPRNV
jgi:hypothetical protein